MQPSSSDIIARLTQPGTVLAGKYTVERTIGLGGMGIVVSARHVHVHHRVALKILLPDVASDEVAVERFLREARNATAVQSEHVVRVTDVGTLEDGYPYLVMEYLEGADLSRILTVRGPLAISEAVDYVMQVLLALTEAHGAGIVHRDLKPSNLFVTERADGTPLVKVLDFGISKAVTATSALTLTSTRGMMGSPLYMAPEQIRSAKLVDQRVDIWSVGVILHELLTGQPPFHAEALSGVLAAIVADPPVRARSVRAEIPIGLESVILRCLEKDPNTRFPNTAELAQALAPFATPEGQALARRIVATAQRKNLHTASQSSPPQTSPLDAPAEATAAVDPPLIATAGAWTHPSPARFAGNRARWLALAGAGVLSAVSFFAWTSGSSHPEPPPEPTSATPAPPAPPAQTTPTPEPPPKAAPAPRAPVVVSPSGPPAPPASAASPAKRSAPAATRLHKPPVTARPAPGPKPGTSAPKPTRDVSELIDDRR